MRSSLLPLSPFVCAILFLLPWFSDLTPVAVAEESAELPSSVMNPPQFNRDVRPILAENCFSCHGADSAARQADLRLDVRDAAVDSGAIVPGDAASSGLWERINSSDPEFMMPPPKLKKVLSDEQKEILKDWIQSGAVYERHWSFLPVSRERPAQDNGSAPESPSWAASEMDRLILSGIEKQGWQPAPPASKETWLRRVTFDLTGLPPTLEDLDRFLADESEDAYERVVDRLLAAPEYGERMAAVWLDAARYADTFGYQADREMHVWPFRDWCIRAFNSNLPYDQFLTWQIAGDLLPGATQEQRLATAFNRLHRQTNEGGSVPEEFRQAYIADRVSTMGTAMLGMSLECARCHDHKFDPITQKNFYELAAFFSDIDEFGVYSHFTETAPTPAMPLYEGDQQLRHAELLAAVKACELALEQAKREAAAGDWQSEAELGDLPQPVAQYNFDELVPQGDYKPGLGPWGKCIEFGGDDAYTCDYSGEFTRSAPFSIAFWIKPGDYAARRVILHRSAAAEDAAFRGYSVTLDEGNIAFALVHFWPGDACRLDSKQKLPLGEWTHVIVTYDGSSTAAGMNIYLGGKKAETSIVRDQLTRDIVYRGEWGDSGTAGLALGARFRDVGLRDGALDELQVFSEELSQAQAAQLARESKLAGDAQLTGEASAVGKAELAAKESPSDNSALLDHYLRKQNAKCLEASKALQGARQAENEFASGIRQVMTMTSAKVKRPTHLLKRGAYDMPGEEVTPHVPESLFPVRNELPRTRLGLAQWLTDAEHPLVSRVAVNRLWQIFWGRGLASSLADIGTQCPPPTNPELLDWLAHDFVSHGWDVKRLCKQIVLSAAYRQSSLPSAKQGTIDNENKFLARGPSHRLSAEQIRDNALAVSGLLVRKVGGPSVFPYQPAGLWEEAGVSASYSPSHGEGLYRRSLYTFWRRTSPPPSMVTFDATSREVCTAKRELTATPLQALVLLNDPQFVEAARVMAEHLLQSHVGDAKSAATQAFRQLTSRTPSEVELSILLQLLQEQRQHFVSHAEDAALLLGVGEAPRDTTLDAAEHAAMTVLVQALLSHDECVTKR